MNSCTRFKSVLSSLTTVLVLSLTAVATPSAAAIATGQRGTNLQVRSDTTYASDDFRQSLANFAVTGGDYADFLVMLQQADFTSCNIWERSDNNPDWALRKGLRNAKQLGLKRAIKIHLELVYSKDRSNWRYHIIPADPVCWQANWDKFQERYAKIAQEEGVELFIMGAEQAGTTIDRFQAGNAARWGRTIDKVRAIFKGKVTYSANRGGESLELDPAFVSKLDYLGVSFYPALEVEQTVVSFKRELENKYLAPWLGQLWIQYRKPILIVETGFWSNPYAYNSNAPKDPQVAGTYDPAQQQKLYEAMFSFLNDRTFLAGIHTWKWDVAAAPQADQLTSYSVHGKPAEATQASWFGGKVPQDINVWWPEEGAILTAPTAVKAKLLGKSSPSDDPAPSAYTMRYRVDSGAWVNMTDSTVSAPHKEAAMDPTGWKQDNHFVEIQALDLSGNIVGITLREVIKSN